MSFNEDELNFGEGFAKMFHKELIEKLQIQPYNEDQNFYKSTRFCPDDKKRKSTPSDADTFLKNKYVSSYKR